MSQKKTEKQAKKQTKKCEWCNGRGFFYIMPERCKIIPTNVCTICNGAGEIEDVES